MKKIDLLLNSLTACETEMLYRAYLKWVSAYGVEYIMTRKVILMPLKTIPTLSEYIFGE